MENPINPSGTPQNGIVTFSLNDLSAGSTLTTNVSQECIVTTYDKVKLILKEYEDAKKMASNWYSYLCMAISFLIPALTVEFKDIWIFDAAFIRAAFWLAFIVSGIITAKASYKRIRRREEIKLDYCLEKMRNNQKAE